MVHGKDIDFKIGASPSSGLKIRALKMLRLSRDHARGFYAVHRERPFYDSLTTFMASGPVVVLVLAGDDAIKRNRDLMGATDPAKADPGTIRAVYGTNIEFNVVHGSDSPDSARFEIGYFFPEMDLLAR